jgi:hypothetical protein
MYRTFRFWPCGTSDIGVIRVWGISGVGKSSLFGLVYYEEIHK